MGDLQAGAATFGRAPGLVFPGEGFQAADDVLVAGADGGLFLAGVVEQVIAGHLRQVVRDPLRHAIGLGAKA
ncbi:hypothetical protein D3C85_1417220 [compost metagenome]